MTDRTRRASLDWLTLAFAAMLVGGCIASPPAGTATPTVASAPPSSTATRTPSAAATPTPTPGTPTAAPPSPTASCAAQTLASLTEAQRIGQLFMLGLIDDRLDAAHTAAIARYHFGSAWYTTHTSVGVAGVRRVSDVVQAQATPAATGGVRFFVAANQEGGLIQALAGSGFDVVPSALQQGTLQPSVLQARATRWGRQLMAAGVNFNFAPVADVVPPGMDDQNAPIGKLRREFGHDPATVSSHVAAFIAGMTQAGVATSAKHFPGLGRVVENTDFSADVTDSVTTRHDPYVAPFARAVEARVPFVMVALATYERIDANHLAAFSSTVMRGMLRDDLGFRGVVISDSLTAAAVASIPPGTRAIDFLNAGGDMIISRALDPAIAMARAIASRAEQNATFRRRVDDAALHVLNAKEAAGLLPCG